MRPTVATARGLQYYFRGTDHRTIGLGYGELRGRGPTLSRRRASTRAASNTCGSSHRPASLPTAPEFIVKDRNPAGRGKAPSREQVPPGQMYEYLLDRAIRLARAGEADPDVIDAALLATFERKRVQGAGYGDPAAGRRDTRRLAEWAAGNEIAMREAKRNALAGQPLRTAYPQPIRGCVMTRQLLGNVEAFLQRFIVFASDAQVAAVALWLLHTHAIKAAEVTPYLNICSPEKRAGKSRLLELLAALAADAVHVANISEAALFRMLGTSPTLLIDEVDALFASNGERTEALRGIINAGNRRGVSVVRCVGANHTPSAFECSRRRCLAGIDTGKLPDTIADRSITLRMKRKVSGESVERLLWVKVKPEAHALRDQIAGWAAEHRRCARALRIPPSPPSWMTAPPRHGGRCSRSLTSLAANGLTAPARPRSRCTTPAARTTAFPYSCWPTCGPSSAATSRCAHEGATRGAERAG